MESDDDMTHRVSAVGDEAQASTGKSLQRDSHVIPLFEAAVAEYNKLFAPTADLAKSKKREPSDNMCYRLHRASLLPEEYLSEDNRDKLFDITFDKKDGEYLFMHPGVPGRKLYGMSILDYDIEHVGGYTVKVSISTDEPVRRNARIMGYSFTAETIAKSTCCLCGEPCEKSGKVSVCKPSCLG